MRAVLPLLLGFFDQPQAGLVHQRRCLSRVSGSFARHPVRGQPAQLLEDQRQQLLRCHWTFRNAPSPSQAFSSRHSPALLTGFDARGTGVSRGSSPAG
jgi:hypothetical protein